MWLAVFAIVLLVYWWNTRYPSLSHLPGPRPFPLIGNLHQIVGQNLYELSSRWALEYGPVMKVRLLNRDYALVNSMHETLEALVKKDDFSGVIRLRLFDILTMGGKDVFRRDYDDELRYMRKVFHRAIKQHGDGMEEIEEHIQEESSELLSFIGHMTNEDVNPSSALHAAICNMVLTMGSGEKFHYESELSKALVELDLTFSNALKEEALFTAIPPIKYLPIPRIKETWRLIHKKEELFEKILSMYLKPLADTYDPKVNRGFVDALLHEYHTAGDQKFNFNDMLIPVLGDILVAGTTTSTVGMISLILILAHHPEVQEKMYEEIDRVIGTGRLPTIKDREFMPYCSAVVREMLRYNTIALATTHCAIKDSSISGYPIKKGTPVVFSIWAMHHDPKAWSDPKKFNPENFLDDEGQMKPIGDHEMSYLPFSAGRRSCPGEALGKSRIFLLAVSIVQAFRIFPPSDLSQFPPCDLSVFKQRGLNVIAPDYKVQFENRLVKTPKLKRTISKQLSRQISSNAFRTSALLAGHRISNSDS